ncbi:MAG TPA: cytochrome C oxidase subunit IV family protein [Anaeromyxobacteraceae bacterium]|nr:cytochrome C oxidase subunit IV family protein [Anaeromyxobacteraceae bacterium]
MSATTHSEGKHLGPAQYVMVWAALMVLTGVTLAVWKTDMSYGMRVFVALAIATVKAALVAIFFMHLWEEKGVARLVLVVSAMFVALLIGLTLADNATRFPYANPPYSGSWQESPWQRAAPPMQAEPPPVEVSPRSTAEHPAAHKP